MKTQVSPTSVAAYHSLRNEGTQAEKIFEYVSDTGPSTIAMIAKGLRMEKSTVSARVNGLVHGIEVKGGVVTEPSLELAYIDKCPVTGVKAKFWKQIEPEYITSKDFKQLRLDEDYA